jgi:hypothetical protein
MLPLSTCYLGKLSLHDQSKLPMGRISCALVGTEVSSADLSGLDCSWMQSIGDLPRNLRCMQRKGCHSRAKAQQVFLKSAAGLQLWQASRTPQPFSHALRSCTTGERCLGGPTSAASLLAPSLPIAGHGVSATPAALWPAALSALCMLRCFR